MPSFSTTAAKVLETCNDPQSSPHDLARVISLDPVLTAQVLRFINSAYYSLRFQITSLVRAITMLGLNTIKNLALSFAILGIMNRQRPSRMLTADGFWTHCLCVAVTARCLAESRGFSGTQQEEYFVAGLLHDLGKIPLSIVYPSEYSLAIDEAQRRHIALYKSEHAVLGIDHCLVGKWMAAKWQLNPSVCESLAHHHDLDCTTATNQLFVALIALANVFANLMDFGSFEEAGSDPSVTGFLLSRLDMDWASLYELRDVVTAKIEKAKIFLEIVQKG
jgi:HD-like signal output (HDOD) protein